MGVALSYEDTDQERRIKDERAKHNRHKSRRGQQVTRGRLVNTTKTNPRTGKPKLKNHREDRVDAKKVRNEKAVASFHRTRGVIRAIEAIMYNDLFGADPDYDALDFAAA